MITEVQLSQSPISGLDQTTQDPLEMHRFSINPESMRMFKAIRSELGEMQKDKPWIKGVGLFGSRTKGQENSDSDTDLIVFYDSGFEFNNVVESDVDRLMHAAGTSVDLHPFEDDDFTSMVYKYDISSTNLTTEIGRLKNLVNYFDAQGQNMNDQSVDSIEDEAKSAGIETGTIDYLFMLSVGEGVYKARKFVLDELRQIPEGDAIISYISRLLADQEREKARKKRPETPNFDGYPKSLDEAEKYFTTREYTSEEFPKLSNRERLKLEKDKSDDFWKSREKAINPKRHNIARKLGKLVRGK